MPSESRQQLRYTPSTATVVDRSSVRGKWFAGIWELTKPRLSFLSIVTALVGYLTARPERDAWLFVFFIVGTALSAGGAATLNQWYERRTDALMERTRNRPIPAGVVPAGHAFAFGVILAVAGPLFLLVGVNWLAAALAVATIVTYLFFYTPSKRVTPWSTEIGAVSGALPPLIGWAAARETVDGLGWILFALLFFWQLPHFLSLAWTYRHDYARGGFPMLPVIDQDGRRTARRALIYTIALVLVTLLPVAFRFTGWGYGAAAIALGGVFIYLSVGMLQAHRRDAAARCTFFYSIIYLPALLASLVLDRWLS